MHEIYKSDRVADKLNSMIKKFKNGIVIVEGKHDIETLKKLDVPAMTYNHFISVSKSGKIIKSDRIFYIFMDLDKGGFDKRDKVIDIIKTQSDIEYNVTLGRRLLEFLNVTSVEQIYRQYEYLTKQDPFDNRGYDSYKGHTYRDLKKKVV